MISDTVMDEIATYGINRHLYCTGWQKLERDCSKVVWLCEDEEGCTNGSECDIASKFN